MLRSDYKSLACPADKLGVGLVWRQAAHATVLPAGEYHGAPRWLTSTKRCGKPST